MSKKINTAYVFKMDFIAHEPKHVIYYVHTQHEARCILCILCLNIILKIQLAFRFSDLFSQSLGRRRIKAYGSTCVFLTFFTDDHITMKGHPLLYCFRGPIDLSLKVRSSLPRPKNLFWSLENISKMYSMYAFYKFVIDRDLNQRLIEACFFVFRGMNINIDFEVNPPSPRQFCTVQMASGSSNKAGPTEAGPQSNGIRPTSQVDVVGSQRKALACLRFYIGIF